MLIATILTLSLLTSPTALWPQFRGPTGQGIADGQSVPTDWSKSRNVRWFQSLPGEGWSSPVVADGNVYCSSAIRSEQYLDLVLLVLDLGSGAIQQQVTLFRHPVDAVPSGHSKNTQASPTPIVQGERVYVHFGHLGTACVDRDRKILWKRQIEYSSRHGNGGSPVISGDHLIFNCDASESPFVIALNKNSGTTAWRRPRESDAEKKFSFSTPLVIQAAGKTQILSAGSNVVCAYRPSDGTEIWRIRYDGYSVVPRPVFGEGMVYMSTGFDSPSLIALRVDGQGDVTDTHIQWQQSRGAPNTPSPLYLDGRVYVVSDRGIATCLRAKDGSLIWQQRLGGNFSASPVYAAGRIYFLSESGECTVVATSDEYKEVSRNRLDERTLASPAVLPGQILIRTAGGLYCIEQAS